MSRSENASRNVIWGVINSAISMLLPFLSRTALIYTLGVTYVGLSSLFSSILQMLSFTELGIGSTLIYSMYEPIASGDDDKVCSLLNFYKKAYRIIGIVVLLFGICIIPFLDKLIKSDIPSDVSLYYLFIIYLLNNLVSYFVLPEKASLLIACQRADLNSRITIITKMLLNIGQIIALVLFRNYYCYSILLPITSVINNLISGKVAKRLYPQYYCKGKVEGNELNEIKKNVGGMMYQKIGNIVLSSVDAIVVSTFLGLKVLGVYNGYLYIITSLFGVLSVIQVAIIPSVGNSLVERNREKNYADFRKFNFIYTWIVIVSATCLLCLYQPFMYLWVGKELMLDNEMVFLFVAYFFIFKWLDMINVYREAAGIWWQGRMYPLLAAIINLTTNIILVQIIGLLGILISTIVCLLTVHDTWGVVILKKYYFEESMNLKTFYITQLFYLLVSVIITVTIYSICSLIKIDALPTLLIRGIICLILTNLFLFILLRWTREFKDAKKFIINIVKSKWKYKPSNR